MRLPIFVSFSTLALSACATVFNGETQPARLTSEPDGATVSVTNRKGEVVQSATTPTTLTLERGAGYFRPQAYKISFSKPGYAPREVQLNSSISRWYAGNVIFGGLVGVLVVDPISGAMYTFPKSVTETMAPQAAAGENAATAGAMPQPLRAVQLAPTN